MIVKTLDGKVGRIEKINRTHRLGTLKVPVTILNKNLHPVRKGNNEKAIEFHRACDLNYNIKIIVER